MVGSVGDTCDEDWAEYEEVYGSLKNNVKVWHDQPIRDQFYGWLLIYFSWNGRN